MTVALFVDLPQFRYPAVVGIENCAVVVRGHSLTVSCGFDSSLHQGYTVLVQSAGAQSFTVLFYEAGEAGSPVVTESLTDGLYSVVVFPLTRSGIVGSDAAFTEQVVVTRPPPSPVFSKMSRACQIL